MYLVRFCIGQSSRKVISPPIVPVRRSEIKQKSSGISEGTNSVSSSDCGSGRLVEVVLLVDLVVMAAVVVAVAVAVVFVLVME